MKKLIAVAMLLSVTLCAMSSCEDQTEEFDGIQSEQIEDAQSGRTDRDKGSGNEPD